jgi:succinate dehydrogenase / fumarate reductase cytochrome b subunit
MAMEKTRQKHLDLTSIRLPLPGWVSILHRVSGAVMFLCIPFLLWLFDQSLHSSSTFRLFQSVVANPLAKLVLLGLVWAYMHHLCAGIRYLALDLHLGTGLEQARASSKVVLGVSLVLTALLGARLW